jgi:hypothetical protein
MPYSVVLSDELLKEYYAFKNNESFDNLTIKSLLTRYKPHLTNVKQLNEVGIIDSPLSQSLAQNGFTNQTLEELSELTKYKIILDKEKTNYPYINIFKDEIENNYSATYYKDIPRDKAREHIKALVKNSNYIFIYDKYMTEPTSWNHSKKLFTELLPRKSLTICYPKEYREDHLTDKAKEIKNIYTHWKIIKDTSSKNHRDLHDRYIIIDKKLEIILTSGIDNLFDETSDFTYIVRDLEQ